VRKRLILVVDDEPLEQRLVRFAFVPQLAGELRLLLGFRQHRLQVDHRCIAALGEVALEVEDVRDAARHSGREVATRGPEHDDACP